MIERPGVFSICKTHENLQSAHWRWKTGEMWLVFQVRCNSENVKKNVLLFNCS